MTSDDALFLAEMDGVAPLAESHLRVRAESPEAPSLAQLARRQAAASRYDELLADVAFTDVIPPARDPHSTHLFHQYCVLLPHGTDRDALQSQLRDAGIPTAVYYPTPL